MAKHEYPYKGKFYIDTTKRIPRVVFNQQIIGLSGRLKLVDSAATVYENKVMGKPAGRIAYRSFESDYCKIIESVSDQYDKVDLAIVKDAGGPRYLWSVEISFDEGIPSVREDMQPTLNHVYQGYMGISGIVIKLENQQPLLVRGGEYSQIKVLRMTPAATAVIESVKSDPWLFRQYVEESEETVNRSRHFLTLVRRALKKRKISIVQYFDDVDQAPTYIVNELRRCKDNVFITSSSTDKICVWSPKVSLKINMASPYILHLQQKAETQEDEVVDQILHLYFRSILRSISSKYFEAFPSERSVFHDLDFMFEDEYRSFWR